MSADPLALMAEVDRATARLVATVERLDDEAVRRPSPLPGWTRGHVLTHIARNADGCTNLLTWARTGVETPQYESMARREADIAAGADRPAAEQLVDIRTAAEQFAAAVAAMPPDRWAEVVRWANGGTGPAATVVWARLREVEVHHVDLAAGYRPADWPAAFVHRLLHELARGLETNPAAPALVVHATDLGHELTVGPAATARSTVRGPGHAVAAWLAGRSTGAGLTVTPDGPLPPVPTWK